MEITHEHDEEQANLFVGQLRRAIKQTYCEQFNARLTALCTNTPTALPLISTKLESLQQDPDYTAMIGFLNASAISVTPEFIRYFSSALFGTGNALSRAIFRLRQAMQAKRNDHSVEALIDAMTHAHSSHDKWIMLKVGFFSLNNMGQHSRAQAFSFAAYDLAQQLDNEAMLQRSRLSILISTRLLGNADLRIEFQRELQRLLAGSLLYPQTNQCLVPSYAAMHQMDLGEDDKTLRKLLHTSQDYTMGEYSALNSNIAWARYNCLSGRTRVAKRQLHEIAEDLTPSLLDLPVRRSLQTLTQKLRVPLDYSARLATTPASQNLWYKFDLEFNHFRSSIQDAQKQPCHAECD